MIVHLSNALIDRLFQRDSSCGLYKKASAEWQVTLISPLVCFPLLPEQQHTISDHPSADEKKKTTKVVIGMSLNART